MLAVQDRLDKVQLTIEQLTAELKSLRETTTYGTITVSLSEKDTTHVVAAGTSSGHLLALDAAARPRRPRDGPRADCPSLPFLVVFGAVGRGRLVRGATLPAAPPAGAADPAGLTP